MIVRYSIFVRPDLMQVFWARMQAGDFISEAVEPIKTSRRTGRRILSDAGGVRPRRGRDLKGRCLSFAEREEIALRRIQGQTLREIGVAVGRSASIISRELRRNHVAGIGYRATNAHALAFDRAARPKPAKLHVNTELRAKVERDLAKKYSPGRCQAAWSRSSRISVLVFSGRLMPTVSAGAGVVGWLRNRSGCAA